jgi:hypothetical protein
MRKIDLERGHQGFGDWWVYRKFEEAQRLSKNEAT